MMLSKILLALPRLVIGARRFTMPRSFRRDGILREGDFHSDELIGGHNPTRGLLEQLRRLYLGIQEEIGETGSVAICSPREREGRSLIAVDLAISVAHDTERPVTILDLDLGEPCLHELLDAAEHPGFTDFHMGDDVSSILSPTDHAGLFLIQAGSNRSDGVRALQSGTLEDVLKQLEARGHFVVVDTAACNSNVSARIVAERVSGVLTVVKLGKTRRSDLAPYYRAMDGIRLLGVACNYHEQWIPRWLQRFL